MQNLFVKENEEFIVKFTVATDEEGTIFCDINRESLIESIKETKNMDVQDYKVVFKRPSFGDTTKLYDSIFSLGDDGVNFNPLSARYNKIVALIKSWNLNGKEEKPTEQDIRSLHPLVATVIGIQVDLHIGPVG